MLKKENLELIEKCKKEIKEKEEEMDSINRKSNHAKSRSQTLTNHQRVLKEQILALEEKGKVLKKVTKKTEKCQKNQRKSQKKRQK